MKLLYYLVLSVFLTSCAQMNFYQLIELESDDISENEQKTSSNKDIDLIFDFWSNGGSSDVIIKNKTNRNIYIKHDECQFIINDLSRDYYDNSEYTRSKSTEKRSSRTYSSSSGSSSSLSKTTSNIYGSNNINTGLGALGSSSSNVSSNSSSSGSGASYTSTTASMSSSGVMITDKKIFILAPNSYRKILGDKLQFYRLSDCDVTAQPTTSKSNRENGLSFDVANTPLRFRFRICYSFDEDFSKKSFYEAGAYVSQFSNWNPKAFSHREKYKKCDNDRKNSYRTVTDLYAPMRYYKTYKKAKR